MSSKIICSKNNFIISLEIVILEDMTVTDSTVEELILEELIGTPLNR